MKSALLSFMLVTAFSVSSHAALTCAEVFESTSAPAGKEPALWNMRARTSLKQLDKTILNLRTAPEATFDRTAAEAITLFRKLDVYGVTRLDALIEALQTNPNVDGYLATSYARNVVFDVAYESPHLNYIVGKFFEAAINARDSAHAHIFADVVFQYGAGGDVAFSIDLGNRLTRMIKAPERLTNRQEKNILILVASMARSRYMEQVRTSSSEESRAYWGLFYEMGLPDKIFHLHDTVQWNLAVELKFKRESFKEKDSVEFAVAQTLLTGGKNPDANAKLFSPGIVTSTRIHDSQSSAVADLWLAQALSQSRLQKEIR